MMRRYPAYRASGVEWLGEVPEGWGVVRLKVVCRVFPSNVDKHTVDGELPVSLCNYTDVYYRETITADVDFMQATATPDEIAKFSLLPGDVIFTKDSETADDIGIAALVAEELPGVICGYHLSIARPGPLTSGSFIKRCFDSAFAKSYFAVSANGLTRVGLGQAATGNLPIPLPPLSEQTAIAAFLDRETGKIDALVAEQRRLIDLLREKRQATISHAVTRGLNPAAPLKPSGIDWLGDVPDGWEVVPLKKVATVQTGIAKGKDNTGVQTIEVPYLRVANVQDGHIDLTEVATIEIPAESLTRYRLQRGDVLMNEGGDFDKLGRGHIWEGQIDPCIHQNHVFAVRPHRVSPDWLNTVTGSDYAQFFFMSRSKQSTNLASISSSNLMELPLLVPPALEQSAIVAFLAEQTARIDSLITTAESAISLLLERRAALISAAVTGKIDVREAA